MSDKNKSFEYTYSAKDQAEIKRIREKYVEPAEKKFDKMEQLRRLDNGVTQKATIVSLVFGIVGTLLLGFGMSLFMTDLSEILGAHKNMAMPLGIIIGVMGGVLASLAYPVYNFVSKSLRKKIAPEIIRLTDELLK